MKKAIYFMLSTIMFGLLVISCGCNLNDPSEDTTSTPNWEGDYLISNNDDKIALSGYTRITGNLIIESDENQSFTDLTGLESLTTVCGGLKIASNDNLTSLIGLENLTTVCSDLYIDINHNLTSLTGLESLTTVGGLLSISYNANMTTLTGLESLTNIGSDLNIVSNTSLISLNSPWDLSYLGGNLYITDNTILPTSLAKDFANHLILNGYTGIVTISGNL